MLQQYAPFLAWLHKRHCINLKRIELYPKPRIRAGKEYGKERCFRIIVNKKLPESVLDLQSSEQWDILHGIYMSEKQYGHVQTFFGLANCPHIKIPSKLEGWPTDICEDQT
jgi:hypothetical protein